MSNEVLGGIIGALISAAGAIIVALIESKNVKAGQHTEQKGILLPEGVKWSGAKKPSVRKHLLIGTGVVIIGFLAGYVIRDSLLDSIMSAPIFTPTVSLTPTPPIVTKTPIATITPTTPAPTPPSFQLNYL